MDVLCPTRNTIQLAQGWESFGSFGKTQRIFQEIEKVQPLCVRTSGLVITFTISLPLGKIWESEGLNCI